jgi:deoxyribose-phosphate aldolase
MTSSSSMVASSALDWKQAARMIDHTILKPDASREQVEKICREALHYDFASVCVNATWVPLVASMLRGSAVKVCTVVGFPLGATLTSVKRFEAEEAIRLGAQEIDMVMNVGAMKSGDRALVQSDIRALVEAVRTGGGILKVILENVLLTDAEKVAACEICVAAGAQFVKTSTGFAAAGATPADVALMRRTVGQHCGVKAAGGIRTAADLKAMVAAGANRIGASASVAIVRELGAE